jgi:hypothetical protein
MHAPKFVEADATVDSPFFEMYFADSLEWTNPPGQL